MREIPPAAAARIRAAQADVERARARASEIALAVLDGLGCDTTNADDGLIWNVLDRDDGSMVAVRGPRMTGLPVPVEAQAV